VRHANAILVALAIVVGFLALYSAAYLSLVKAPSDNLCDIELGPDRIVYLPRYRTGGDIAEVTFAPAHWIDRQIRPEHWGVGPASPYDMEVFR
jgi:hypothetical protein